MGWSCRADAGKVMDKMTQFCIGQTDSQNRYKSNGEEYFWELSRTEHDDGAITGTIWKFINGGTHCKRSGSFRIEGDGTVTRMPNVLKKGIAKLMALEVKVADVNKSNLPMFYSPSS